MHSQGVPPADVPGWRKLQIAAAQPVTSNNTSFRSDELLGIDVRTPQNEALGSVEDLVMSSQTGKIAYLVIARGGIFGFDEKYVPVPWEDFKVTPARNLLVLDTTKGAMERCPAGEQRPIRDTRPIRSGESEGGCLLEGAPLEQRQQLIVSACANCPRRRRGAHTRGPRRPCSHSRRSCSRSRRDMFARYRASICRPRRRVS